MILAVIKTDTNIVENIVVPPVDGNPWGPPTGYFTVLTDVASIGDSYVGGEFVRNGGEFPPEDTEEPV